MCRLPALALLLVTCGAGTSTSTTTSTPTPAVPFSTADPIVWQLAASATTLAMTDRGTFELWIVARNAGARLADSRRDNLEYVVNGQPSLMLALAYGNGLRVAQWYALPPGETLREARGGSTDPGFGEALFPSPGEYELTLRQGGRAVAGLHVRITASP